MSTTDVDARYRWYYVDEAAEYLDLTERQVRRAVHDGRLGHTKLGLQLRFSREQLDAFVEASKRPAVRS